LAVALTSIARVMAALLLDPFAGRPTTGGLTVLVMVQTPSMTVRV
jgi:nitrate/nitrite transporter NarK